MVKLIYNGLMAKGRVVATNFKQDVDKGITYDIPEELVESFLNSGEWLKPRKMKFNKKDKKKKEEEEIELEDIYTEDE